MKEEKCLIVFDGYCHVCSWWVDFVLRRDKKARFLFVAAQSKAGTEVLSRYGFTSAESVMLIENEKLYLKSEAVLRIGRKLGFPWTILNVFLMLPLSPRDALYQFIASRRYRWWGRRASCRQPSEEEHSRFL
ncbi:MAG: DUF393 domain-containing protein [Bacteroidia bacterium]|nr:DUF393 domain-containing protein [Bacteroidia bacterium]